MELKIMFRLSKLLMLPRPRLWVKLTISFIFIAFMCGLYLAINPEGRLIVGGFPPKCYFFYSNRLYPKNGILLDKVTFIETGSGDSRERVLWSIYAEGSKKKPLALIDYGKVPLGWSEDATAQPIGKRDSVHIRLKFGLWERTVVYQPTPTCSVIIFDL
ncbi:MAG: hypothetical protein K2X81_25330 [Candidatus Obscuribacterales bacterium]|nr:hypothetical protein [Candidatus Obscuribacterales bacterium]